MAMNPRLLRPLASGVHPEAAAWRTAVIANGGGTPSAVTMRAVSKLCSDIDKANIRSLIWRMNIFAGPSLNAALVPLYRGPSRTGTQYGLAVDESNGSPSFGENDYTETGANGGLKGNGTSKYLNTGFEQQSISLANFHLSASYTDLETSYGANRILIGHFNGLQTDFVNLRQESSTGNFSFYAATFFGISTTAASSTTHVLGVRSAANRADLYRGGVSVANSTTNVGTPSTSSRPYWIFGSNAQGSLQLPTAVRMRLYSIGQAIDSTGAQAFHDAVAAFNTSMGRT